MLTLIFCLYFNCEPTPLQRWCWRSHFGVYPQASYDMWLLIYQEYSPAHPRGMNLMDYFMTIFFLKTYLTFHVLASRVKKKQKKIQKWVWWYIRMMAFVSPVLVIKQMQFYIFKLHSCSL